MLTYVDHIDMMVEDIQKEIEFLQSLGLEIKRNLPERNSVEMCLPGEKQVVFELHACGEKKPGIRHIAFHVADENTVAELKANGVKFRTENKFVDATGRTVSNADDPNGNSWQLTD